ncbi:MAG: alginate export family protein, partial [Anaerolineales bacterium]
DEERRTIGGRVYSKWDSNWTWWAELALQSGEFDTAGTTTDISANGFEGELAYQWKKAKVRPKVHGRYSMFTGEDDDRDESEAFDPLFQDTHGRYGLFDLFIPVNLNVLEVGVSWNGKEDRHVFGANFLQFTSNEETVAGVDVSEDDLGTELDLYYNYQYSKNVMIQAAIAQFAPGDQFDPSTGPGAADSMPGVAATSDDTASRVYANTRIRW